MTDVAFPRSMTVNDAIRMYPRTVELFTRLGIDTCCGGAMPIAEAAERHGADVAAVMTELMRIVREGE